MIYSIWLCKSFTNGSIICETVVADSSKENCVPFYCDGLQVGLILPLVLTDLLQFSNIFEVLRTDEGVVLRLSISEKLRSVEERTSAINEVLKDLQSLKRYTCLQGWRNEVHM